MRKVLLVLIIVACARNATPQQVPQERPAVEPHSQVVFRSQVNFVEVHAIVTDRNGMFVRGLTKDDFEIYEAGRLQELSAFSMVDVPIERPLTPTNAGGPLEWDVRATSRVFDGRIYVLALDDLHTTTTRSQSVRNVAKRFVDEYLGPGDVAAVVYTSGRQEAGQELTGSRRLLLAAIDRFQGQKLPPAGAERLAIHLRQERPIKANEGLSDRTIEGLERAESVRDPNAAERMLNVRRALESVQKVAAWLADVQGRRKALMFFSEGFDYDIYEPFDRGVADSLLFDVQQAVGAAQRANVTVYGIDPRGLNQFDGLIDINARSDYPQLEYGTFRGALRELLLSQESLISLAEQTGGLAIVNSGDVAGGLGRIVLDNSRYYLLGYHSDAKYWSGKFLPIEVRAKRTDLRIRARQGYLPPHPKAIVKKEARTDSERALAVALRKPLPVGDLSVRAFAAPFRSTGKNTSVLVAVEIDGHSLTFDEIDGRFNNRLEVSIVATDQRSRVQGGDRQTFNLRLLPETYNSIRRAGVRLLSRLEVTPGTYQIRVGVHETSGRTAMVPYDLEVPDYSRLAVGLSGVVLTSSEAGSFATANRDEPLKDSLPAAPVVRRRFSVAETLTSFVEVYDNAHPAAREIAVTFTVQDAVGGRTVFTAHDRRPVKNGRAASEAFKMDIPLQDLRSGLYVLSVRATSTASDGLAERKLPFEVIP